MDKLNFLTVNGGVCFAFIDRVNVPLSVLGAYFVLDVVTVNVKGGVAARRWTAVGPRCPSLTNPSSLIVPRRENKTISDKYINIPFGSD